MITMAEIARLTLVWREPTLSRVLNGNKTVNPEIREKVLACAREHDFQPNVMAQSLVGSRQN
ncbi:MAG: LacI family DNA-binding transcriptional regulator [Lachnospiraceae bacterium]